MAVAKKAAAKTAAPAKAVAKRTPAAGSSTPTKTSPKKTGLPAKKTTATKPKASAPPKTTAKAEPTQVLHTVCNSLSNPPPHVIAAMVAGEGPPSLICMGRCSGALRPADEFELA